MKRLAVPICLALLWCSCSTPDDGGDDDGPALLEVTEIAEGDTTYCDGNGGNLLTYGDDVDGDGVLSAEEITERIPLCNDEAPPTPAVIVDTTSIEVQEAGAAETVSVVLATEPSAEVVVQVSIPDANQLTLSDGATTGTVVELTFTTTDWMTPQVVSISAVDDALDDGDVSVQVEVAVGSTLDTTGYADLTSSTIDVLVLDDDGLGVTITPTQLALHEGETTTVEVSLEAEPDGDVGIALTSTDGRVQLSDAVSPTPAMTLLLVIAPGQWQTPHVVTLHAVEDVPVTENGSLLVTADIDLGATTDQTGYAGLTEVDDVTVLYTDNDVIFVDAAATGAQDGTSWADAFTTVQAAVDAAQAGQAVWVAQGTYRPAAANESVLVMKDEVEIYGGFAGTEEALWERPQPLVFSELSGDLLDDDTPGDLSTNKADNSWVVVYGASDALLNGFRIVGASDQGMRAQQVTGLVLANLEIAEHSAGGMEAYEAEGDLVNVTFSGNQANNGAGLFAAYSILGLSNVSFIDNAAYSQGGGLYVGESTVDLQGATFDGNTADHGGGMCVSGFFSHVDLVDCRFVGNSVIEYGGGLYSEIAQLNLNDVVFQDNEARERGGGMLADGGLTTLNEVVFLNNFAEFDAGGGLYTYDGEITLNDVKFLENYTLTAWGAGMYVLGTIVELQDVVFVGNSVNFDSAAAGGLYAAGTVTGTNVTFRDNYADGNAGGLFIYGARFWLTNASFEGNTSLDKGGAVMTGGTDVVFTNVSFDANSAVSGAGGITLGGSGNTVLNNVVLWGNTGSLPSIRDIEVESGPQPTVSNTCSQQPLTGTGNVTITADPFVRGASGELFLDPGSSCVDSGSDAAANHVDCGFGALGLIPWSAMTTRIDAATLDTGTVDMGRHYDPGYTWVQTFTADAADVTWTTYNATHCRLSNDADTAVFLISGASLVSGSQPHNQTSGTTMMLSCSGLTGPTAFASVVVP